MRYRNYILSKGDRVKLKPDGDDWLPSMTKKYGGKVVTIKDFIYNIGFVCEPLGDDDASYMFDVNDIDDVVYCKNGQERRSRNKTGGRRMNKYDIMKALKCCAGRGTYCINCPYYNNGEFSCDDGKMDLDALNIITEQEKEIERLEGERNGLAEILARVHNLIDGTVILKEYEK